MARRRRFHVYSHDTGKRAMLKRYRGQTPTAEGRLWPGCPNCGNRAYFTDRKYTRISGPIDHEGEEEAHICSACGTVYYHETEYSGDLAKTIRGDDFKALRIFLAVWIGVLLFFGLAFFLTAMRFAYSR